MGERAAAVLRDRGAYDVYDEKVMEETTFYGLPFWHFSRAGLEPELHAADDERRPIVGAPRARWSASRLGRRHAEPVRPLPADPADHEPAGDLDPAGPRSLDQDAQLERHEQRQRDLGYPTIDSTRTSRRRTSRRPSSRRARSPSSTRWRSGARATTSTSATSSGPTGPGDLGTSANSPAGPSRSSTPKAPTSCRR